MKTTYEPIDQSQNTKNQCFLLCTKCKTNIPSIRFKKKDEELMLDLICRECKEEYYMPPEDYIKEMQEIAKKKHYCTNKKQQHALAPAVLYCQTCSCWICSDCDKDHTEIYSQLVNDIRIPTQIFIDTKCQEHQGNQYEYYCEDCNQSLCKDCLNSHKKKLHTILTKEELLRESNVSIKQCNKHYDTITKSNEKNKDYAINQIDKQIKQLQQFRENILITYEANQKNYKVINDLTVIAVANQESLSRCVSFELLSNIKHMLPFDTKEPNFDSPQLECAKLIEYYKSNYIVNMYFKTKNSNGDVYDGEMVNGKYEGYGVLSWANGSKYKGQWKNQKQNGKGIYTDAKGNSYEGEWVDNMIQGYGVFKWTNGAEYKGYWKANQHYGQGTKKFPNGNKYEGDWVNNQLEGYGVFHWSNGTEYKGQWKQGKHHGKGIKVFSFGDQYDGEWVEDKFEGYGEYIWKNKDRYRGQWKDGKQNGKGKKIFSNGNIYEGNWVNNEIKGNGNIEWIN